MTAGVAVVGVVDELAVFIAGCSAVIAVEEAPGDVNDGIRQLLRDPVSGQVEETDLMHGVAQVIAELRGLLRASAQSGKVQDGQ